MYPNTFMHQVQRTLRPKDSEIQFKQMIAFLNVSYFLKFENLHIRCRKIYLSDFLHTYNEKKNVDLTENDFMPGCQ